MVAQGDGQAIVHFDAATMGSRLTLMSAGCPFDTAPNVQRCAGFELSADLVTWVNATAYIECARHRIQAKQTKTKRNKERKEKEKKRKQKKREGGGGVVWGVGRGGGGGGGGTEDKRRHSKLHGRNWGH